jgi:hypothetical protein
MSTDVAGAVERMVARLDAAGIPYMLVGSVAALVHGHARSTLDADIVIDPAPGALRRFVGSLDEQKFYVSEEAATDALRRRGQFNVIDFESGLKVDLIVRKQSPFHEAEFERRRMTDALGQPTMIATPEDVILSKLLWGLSSGSERQLEDARALVDLGAETLDWEHLERWATQLGIEDRLALARAPTSGAT